MKLSIRRPLFLQVLVWLLLNMVVLALAFFGFVRWQLGLGLESFMGGEANERLLHFAQAVSEETEGLRPDRWDEAIENLAAERGVSARVIDLNHPMDALDSLPANVADRIRKVMPPVPELPEVAPGFRKRPMARDGGAGGNPEPEAGEASGFPGPPDRERPEEKDSPPVDDRAVFLVRGDGGDGYWAGIILREPISVPPPRPRPFLLIRSDRLDGAGMFFDFKPWVFGGLAVLAISVLMWTPFVWGITRYVRKLTAAANRIASGRFDVSLPPRNGDELGQLGKTVQTMAGRLDHLVSGQKRFLGDAAHELCAPLARIRTGMGVLENRVPKSAAGSFQSIEEDVSELATLVDEILDFSRAGNRKPVIEAIEVASLFDQVVSREGRDLDIEVRAAAGVKVLADARLLDRAIGNLIRNAGLHGGPKVKVVVGAREKDAAVELYVRDNGPGVPPEELPRLFEPFYRTDRSRSRETGGNGLGLAIVRGAVVSCGGEVEAKLPDEGGFQVSMRLPRG